MSAADSPYRRRRPLRHHRARHAALAAIREALDRHIVLHFRGQHLVPAQIAALGRPFGPLFSLKRPDGLAHHIETARYLKVISNAVADEGRPVGDGSGAAQDGHSDGAAKPRPASYSSFFAARQPYWWSAALQVGDFIVWDNRAALHRRDGWDPAEEHVLWHLVAEGEIPVPAPPSA